MSMFRSCVSMVIAVAVASVWFPAREAHATVVDSGDAYVCTVNIQPAATDPRGGSFGYVYVQLSTAPACGGTKFAGYLYSSGASFTGTEFRTTALYSEAALMAVYLSLIDALQSGKRTQMYVSTQSPHFQVFSTTFKAS